MYVYDQYDQHIIEDRVRQFRDQTRRFLAGELADEEFRPLRLQNGLYIQRYAPMLRVAVPYGLLSSTQVRKLAEIARHYDKGYAHISTRTNVQFNWPELEDVPEILAELATVQMHAIQTSGNCIRNTTTDQFAGVAKDELIDPRPWCEIIRQWSTFHPEFAFLPRKFKIAVNGAVSDRAAIEVHDIGLEAVKKRGRRPGLPCFGRRRPRADPHRRQLHQRISALAAPVELSRRHPAGPITAMDVVTTSSRHASRFWSRRSRQKCLPSASMPNGRTSRTARRR